MVEIKYLIDPSDADEFLYFMRTEIRRMRRRNGAITWGLFQDTDDKYRCVEVYVEESWLQHLRSHQGLTKHDMSLIDKARSFHRGSRPPEISRKISRRPSREFLETRAASQD